MCHDTALCAAEAAGRGARKAHLSRKVLEGDFPFLQIPDEMVFCHEDTSMHMVALVQSTTIVCAEALVVQMRECHEWTDDQEDNPQQDIEVHKEFNIGLDAYVEEKGFPDKVGEEHDEPRLDSACDWRNCRVVDRANFLSQNRIDVQCASKETRSQMSDPRASGEARMKRNAWCLLR